MAGSLRGLAGVLFARGSIRDAETVDRQALAIRDRLIPGSKDQAESLWDLASLLRAEGQLSAAEELFKKALDALEKQALNLGGGRVTRSRFRERHVQPYMDYIDLL